MAYTKERAKKIIQDNLIKIRSLEALLGKLRTNRARIARNISAERRSKITFEMLSQYDKKRTNSLAWMCKDVVNTNDEQRWMIETSTIFSFSNQLSNLKKKNQWMKQIATKSNQKTKKIYVGSTGNWTAYFAFLLNFREVSNKEQGDYVFYKLETNVKSIAQCVDDSNKIPQKLIVCIEKENLEFLRDILTNNGVKVFNNLDLAIDYISEI